MTFYICGIIGLRFPPFSLASACCRRRAAPSCSSSCLFSLLTGRYLSRQLLSFDQRRGERSTVSAFSAFSIKDIAWWIMLICMFWSYGFPQGFPSGKSVYRYLGAPQCVTMSSAEPMIRVGIPLASRCRATRLTVWWQTGHNGTKMAISALSSINRFRISGASLSFVFRWL